MVRALERGAPGGSSLAFSLRRVRLPHQDAAGPRWCVPAFGLVYLLAGPPQLRRRIGQLLRAGVALLVSAGWWVAIVELMPGVGPAVHRRLAEQQRART